MCLLLRADYALASAANAAGMFLGMTHGANVPVEQLASMKLQQKTAGRNSSLRRNVLSSVLVFCRRPVNAFEAGYHKGILNALRELLLQLVEVDI